MTHLLVTNVLSVTLRDGDSGPAVQLRQHHRSELVVPSIVRAELEFGALKGGSKSRLQTVKEFLSQFPSLPFDDACVTGYSVARNELERTGQRIGALDLMIASVALAHNQILVTHNTSEFARIPGLRIEDCQI